MPVISLIPYKAPAGPTYETVLLLRFDEAANATTLVSDEGKIATASGGAKTSTVAIVSGNTLVKPAAGYVTLPNDNDWVMGTGDFTVETWLESSAAPSAGELSIISFATFSVNAGFVFGFETNNSKSITISTGNGTRIMTGNVQIPYSNTTHIAYSRNSGVGRMFVNGTLAGSGTDTNNYTANNLTIGQISPGITTRAYIGYLDELRITKGLGRYTSNFTPAIPTL